MPQRSNGRRYANFFTAQQSEDHLARDGMNGDYFPNLYAWLRAGGYTHVTHWLKSYVIPAEISPALSHGGKCHRAPRTSSTVEALDVGLGQIEQEIREIVESGDTPGLRGGWISSIVLGRLMAQIGVRRLSPAKLTEALESLGYIHHAALSDGRVNNSIMAPDNGKPRLYLRKGHPAHAETRPAEVARMYVQAQGMSMGAVPLAATVTPIHGAAYAGGAPSGATH
jgi:hypothetical protein